MIKRVHPIIKKLRWWTVRKPARKKRGQVAFLLYKETARTLVHERLENFNKLYGFQFRRISIRNQRTRWGSCSKKGNLNFNYKIILLPKKFADYIVVHELCHLAELNHSRKFWELVARALPDHKETRRLLRKSTIVPHS